MREARCENLEVEINVRALPKKDDMPAELLDPEPRLGNAETKSWFSTKSPIAPGRLGPQSVVINKKKDAPTLQAEAFQGRRKMIVDKKLEQKKNSKRLASTRRGPLGPLEERTRGKTDATH